MRCHAGTAASQPQPSVTSPAAHNYPDQPVRLSKRMSAHAAGQVTCPRLVGCGIRATPWASEQAAATSVTRGTGQSVIAAEIARKRPLAAASYAGAGMTPAVAVSWVACPPGRRERVKDPGESKDEESGALS